MTIRGWFACSLAGALFLSVLLNSQVPACCPAGKSGAPVVNADQTVILIWDAATKTQHFIRKASFQSEGDDFGFLVPTPTQPELEESGNDAFPYLLKLTEPERKKVPRPARGMGCGCSDAPTKSKGEADKPEVRVLNEKLVAGFKAVVLEAKTTTALVGWLKEHGYAYSPEVAAWAKPYVENGWMITALKVAKDGGSQETKSLTASALRLTFKTDRPLFPYREPDSRTAAQTLGARNRLLRIYFLAEARYQGELAGDTAWTGKVAWASALDDKDRKKVLELLKLPQETGPAKWWLTEFEDNWPYQVAPGDVTFSRDRNQFTVKRDPIIEYTAAPLPTDVTVYAIAGAMFLPVLLRRVRRGRVE